METYIFILGRDPQLSEIELTTYLSARNIKFQIKESSDTALVLEMPSINAKKIIKELGGTQKIAKVIKSFTGLYRGKENKIRYAISNYTDDESLKDELKAYFRQQGIKALIKKSGQKQPFLSPSEAQGVIEIIQYTGLVAKTVAVFNPNDHKLRDTGRPFPSSDNQISIRLAKILVNISGIKSGEKLLDVNCGIGTIIQEALLMDMDVTGLEVDGNASREAKDNLDWIRRQYNPKSRFKVLKADPRAASRFSKKVDYVVSKFPMGPLQRNYPRDIDAKQIVKKLRMLYDPVLGEIKRIKPKRAVIVTPRFRTKSKKEVSVRIRSLFKKHGFSVDEPIIYSSPSSRMMQEIWVLKLDKGK